MQGVFFILIEETEFLEKTRYKLPEVASLLIRLCVEPLCSSDSSVPELSRGRLHKKVLEALNKIVWIYDSFKADFLNHRSQDNLDLTIYAEQILISLQIIEDKFIIRVTSVLLSPNVAFTV